MTTKLFFGTVWLLLSALTLYAGLFVAAVVFSLCLTLNHLPMAHLRFGRKQFGRVQLMVYFIGSMLVWYFLAPLVLTSW